MGEKRRKGGQSIARGRTLDKKENDVSSPLRPEASREVKSMSAVEGCAIGDRKELTSTGHLRREGKKRRVE